jgi:hypothetical protein
MTMKCFFAVEKYLDKNAPYTAVWFNIKVKVKIYPRTGHEGPEREEKYGFTFPLTWALDGVDGQRHAPVSFLQGKKRYPRYRRLVGPQGRSRGAENLAPHLYSISGPSSP